MPKEYCSSAVQMPHDLIQIAAHFYKLFLSSFVILFVTLAFYLKFKPFNAIKFYCQSLLCSWKEGSYTLKVDGDIQELLHE